MILSDVTGIDLADWLESFLRSVDASDVTEWFLWGIPALFLAALILALWGKAERLTESAPTLLTMLGIFGTFIGIVVGLLDFDTERLDASIGELLEGLKTAFITSLAGMFFGIVFRPISHSLQTIIRRRVNVEFEKAIGPENILSELEDQTTALGAIRSSISGDEESSLAGQLKLMRSDSRDAESRAREERAEFSEKLWKELASFADALSKSATEQVINALKEVIVDFNKNLTEQFGENFKALDASVQKLVTWQEQNREEMERLQTLHARSVEALAAVEASTARISESSAAIPGHMEELERTVKAAGQQIDELQRHLEAFAELRNRAVEAVPQAQARVEEMMNDIASAAREAQDRHRELINEAESHVRQQNDKAQEMLTVLAQTGEQVQRDTKTAQEQVAASAGELQRAAEQAAQSLRQHMQDSMSRTGEAVNAQLEALDKAMQDELTRVMEAMGRRLVQISTRYAQQYEEMVRVVDEIRQGRARR